MQLLNTVTGKISLFFVLIFFLHLKVFSQPFAIGHTTVTLIDTSRNIRSIPTEIYYPADSSGINVPVTTANNDRFPVISFGHGFVMTWDAYQNIWNAVVSQGFIMAFPKTETGLAPSHAEFAKDITFVISELNAFDQISTSLFYQRIDSMNCVMGHSMGGGSAFLAAQLGSTVKTLVALAPAETNPSAILASTNLHIPALIFAGANDCITPPQSNQIPMYDSLQSNCKSIISINGGSHCQMADNNFLCSFGEATCTPQPTITHMEQHAVIERYLLPWLKYQLKNDCFSGAGFDSLITTDTSIVFQGTCVLCNTTSFNEHNPVFTIEALPNPFHDEVSILCNTSVSKITVDLYLMNGCKLLSQTFTNVGANEKLKLHLGEKLPAGIYLLKVADAGKRAVRKIIKQ